MKEDFVSIKPNNDFLRTLIDYYYFHNVVNDGTYTVIYHPHYNTAINYYINTEVVLNKRGRILTQNKDQISSCYFTRNMKGSRYVTINGSLRKIGIVFKPLGINHFINCNLNQIAINTVSYFDHFGVGFQDLLEEISHLNDATKKRDKFDDFLLGIYRGFADVGFKHLIENIIKENQECSVKSMASFLGVNRKTLLRKFNKHLCTSPSEYISLIKFRSALHQYDTSFKLTDIAYNSNYYDQSTFIRHYKKLVGLTPKQLFKNISEKGTNQTLWTKIV